MKRIVRRMACCLLAIICLGVNARAAAPVIHWGHATVDATIVMESGEEIHLVLFPDEAPNTVANFVDLALSGFYDGLTFHRVIPGFIIQGGDPEGTGAGDPGFAISGEFSANGFDNPISHERGVISMSRMDSGPGGNGAGYDTAGSQFFIVQQDNTFLDGLYAAFGQVKDINSMAVVDLIAATQTDAYDRPLREWRIKTITVDTQGAVYAPVRIQETPVTPEETPAPVVLAHDHVWVDRTATQCVWVVGKRSYDETVLDKPAWDETVVVKAAYDEQIVEKEAWDEITGYSEGWDEEMVQPDGSIKIVHHGAGIPIIKRHDAVYTTIHHDAETKVVHHEATYKTVHHEEEGHYEETPVVVGQFCTVCHEFR